MPTPDYKPNQRTDSIESICKKMQTALAKKHNVHAINVRTKAEDYDSKLVIKFCIHI